MDDKKLEIDLKKLSDELGAELEDIRMLFQEYCNEMKDEMGEMQKNLEIKNWEKIQRTAHNVKGVSINLGLEEMHRQAEVIDKMMKTNVYNGIEEELILLKNTFQKTEEAINSAFEMNGLKINSLGGG